MLAQTTVFAGLFAISLAWRADALAHPAQPTSIGAFTLSALLMGGALWIWLLTDTILAWCVRIEMTLTPQAHRYAFTPLVIAWATLGGLLSFVMDAKGAGNESIVSALFLAFVILGGASVFTSVLMFAVSLYTLSRSVRAARRIRANFERFKREHPGSDVKRLEDYIEQETRTFDNHGLILRGRAFPGIASRPWYDTSQFDWTRTLEGAYETIKAEALAVYESVGYKEYLYPGVGDPGWHWFKLLNYGKPDEANCARCPKTVEVLKSLPVPLLREVAFFVLKPGAALPSHRDSGNTMLTCHFGLTVPPDCKIKVGGETRAWEEGKCLLFDATYVHSVWNDSSEPRIVLVFDIPHPELTPIEQEFIPCVF